MGNGQATSDQMTLTGIEPADVGGSSDPPLDPAPYRLIAGLSFLCYPLLASSLPGAEYEGKEIHYVHSVNYYLRMWMYF